MRKVKQYKTVCRIGTEQFDKLVNGLLAEGFELYGSHFAITDGDGDIIHSQAMVKYEEIN